jgi:hypothetical protein
MLFFTGVLKARRVRIFFPEYPDFPGNPDPTRTFRTFMHQSPDFFCILVECINWHEHFTITGCTSQAPH